MPHEDYCYALERENHALNEKYESLRQQLDIISKSCLYESEQWAKWSKEKSEQLADSQKREMMLRGFVKLLRDYIPASAVGNMTVQEALDATAPKP